MTTHIRRILYAELERAWQAWREDGCGGRRGQ